MEEKRKIKKLVNELKRTIHHWDCDDSWFSCPKSEDGCADDRQGTACNCGADNRLRIIAEIEKELGDRPTSREEK